MFGVLVLNNFPNDHETVSDLTLFPRLMEPKEYLDVPSVVSVVD